jgi:uncharacterized protein YbaR (Trm112 family)
MCPQAQGAYQAPVKYAYKDHDTAQQWLTPPVLNQWYTIFNDIDVRLLWCEVRQVNTEAAVKTVEVKWTIDNNVYFMSQDLTSNTIYEVYRTTYPSTGGTNGLFGSGGTVNGVFYCDKRGQSFKVEVRITTALGTAQDLRCRCVYETLEVT